MKAIKRLLKMDKEPYKFPKTVRDVIPIKRVWDDGVFQVGTRFSKTFKFTDINYAVASLAAQQQMLQQYAGVLNTFDSTATTKITINNRKMNKQSLEKTVLMEMQHDGLDQYRTEYNDVIMKKALQGNGIIQEKYITISIVRRNVEDARTYFQTAFSTLRQKMQEMGSVMTELNAVERLRILHDFYRHGEEEAYHLNLGEMMMNGHDFRDYICPDSFKIKSDCILMGNKYARALYLKDYSSSIQDDFLMKLADSRCTMMVSIDFIPLPTHEAVQEVQRKLLGVETNIANWQRRQNHQQNFNATVPYDMQQQKDEAREYMEDLTQRDQRIMLTLMTIVHMADSKRRLEADTEAIKKVALDTVRQIDTLRFQQWEGMNTALPIGVRQIDTFRTMTTESAAALMAFKVQEIQEPGGIYFGENKISHNLILCNAKNLLNQSMVILGTSGSGKSFYTKLLLINLILSTNDQIIVLDPENEYTPLIQALGGSVVHLSIGGKDHLNAMDMVEGYGDDKPIAMKSQFIMSLLKQIAPELIGAKHNSIVDNCVAELLSKHRKTDEVPTLCTLREKLMERPEPEARDVALILELYTTGSLDIFAHETNVDLTNRIVSFDIHELSDEMKQPGFVTIVDTILNRVNANWSAGRKTHIFVDEFHVAYQNEFSANFFTSAWRQFRKRNAAPYGITQNVTALMELQGGKAKTILSNSEFVVMLRQAEKDQRTLADLFNISPEEMRHVQVTEPGSGLMKYGNIFVPFTNKFPSDTELYRLITTRPGEGAFAEGQVDYDALFGA